MGHRLRLFINLMMTRVSFLLLLLVAAPLSWAQGTPTKPLSDKKLADFTIGEIISGDAAGEEALRGKVVALEFWGRL